MNVHQKNFIRKMRYYRKLANLTQANVAEKCGVANGTIGNIECGVTKPSFEMIFNIAKALGVEAYQLIKETPYDAEKEIDQINKIHEVYKNAFDYTMGQVKKGFLYEIEHKRKNF